MRCCWGRTRCGGNVTPLPPRSGGGGGGGGGGSAGRAAPRQTRCQRSKLIAPHPRPLPATRKGAWEGGERTVHTFAITPHVSREPCHSRAALSIQRAQGMRV